MSDTPQGTGPAVTPAEPAAAATDAGAPPAAAATTDAPAETPPAAKQELTNEQLVEKNRKTNAENKTLRERAKALEDNLAEFNAWKESQKTEEQKAAERTQALEAENAALKRAALITRVQAASNLPDELVERLRGETEEELLADAKTLAALVTPAPKPAPTPNPGQRILSGEPDAQTAKAIQLFGSLVK